MNSRYALDKSNAKLMGVCSGFARYTDVDPTLVRVTMVLVSLFLGPVAIAAYLLTGFVAAND
jgi:phage shock protein C